MVGDQIAARPPATFVPAPVATSVTRMKLGTFFPSESNISWVTNLVLSGDQVPAEIAIHPETIRLPVPSALETNRHGPQC